MNISELNTGQGNVEVEGVIKEMGEPRIFNKYGKELRVVNALIEDKTGSIKLTLWNEDTNRFKEGDSVKIINGYVNEFQGEKQLTSGKFGTIEKSNKSENSHAKKSTSDKDEISEDIEEEVF